MPVVPGLVGGSADLTGSNGTLTKLHSLIKPGDFAGNYIHYGVREHGMAAAMNGMALHGGIVPYGGTFLVFSDYCRPSIRLSALMDQRVIYVMTHDSIGLGEDGPTHQPVEHLAALRAIPNLYVMRPADFGRMRRVLGARAALAKTRRTILALTRQGVPLLRTTQTAENLSAKGAYVLIEPNGKRDVTLIGTGSELSLCGRGGQGACQGEGITRRRRIDAVLRVVRGATPRPIETHVLGSAPRVAVEAAVEFGWEKWLGARRRLHRHARIRCLWRRRKTYISISASPQRPWRRLLRHVIVKEEGKETDMAKKRVAINGFGRIGRLTFRAYLESGREDLDFVAINDLGSAEMNAHLLEFDSVHGRFRGKIDVANGHVKTNGQDVAVLSEATPEKLPWRDLGVDIVMECTGRFTEREGAAKHLTAGAKRVLVSAPCTGADLTVVFGVNDDKLTQGHHVVSNASCTTNCLAPVAQVLNEAIGIKHGYMTTVHAYTGDQRTVDTLHKDPYRARAAAVNLIPTSTGAAKAVGLVLPELKGKLDGASIRVPVPNVSMIDLTFQAARADQPRRAQRRHGQSR